MDKKEITSPCGGRHEYEKRGDPEKKKRNRTAQFFAKKKFTSNNFTSNDFTSNDFTSNNFTCNESAARIKIERSEKAEQRKRKIAEWLGADEDLIIDEPGERKRSGFIPAICVLSVFLLLMVSGAVIGSEASTEYFAATNRLEALKAKEIELRRETELKDDLSRIEEIARNRLGMIDKDLGSVYFIDEKVEDKVEIYVKK